MASIRPAVASDRDALYDICVRTGDSGEDARPHYADHRLLGEVWVGPYLALEPELAFVAEDDDGIVGYVLGAADSAAFETACEQRWWPELRTRYPDPPNDGPMIADVRLIRRIHHPPATAATVVERFPAHLHVDVLPRGQGHGIGRQLMSALFEALGALGVDGVHLRLGAGNTRALGFYRHLGFRPIAGENNDRDALVLGLDLRSDQPTS